MASTQTVALDFLTKLEADLNAHDTGGTPSIYNFGGKRNGVAVGISRVEQLSLNRGGQIFQFLAGYYSASSTTAAIKARIATAAGKVYKVFNARPVFNSTNWSGNKDGTTFSTTGQFGSDPSGASMMLGLMMLDKQGVIDHANFAAVSTTPTAYIRSHQIPRQAIRLNVALNFEPEVTNSLVSGLNYTWDNKFQKMAQYSINGTIICLAVLSLYSKMYGIADYNTRHTQCNTIANNIATRFGNTYVNGTNTTVSSSGQYPGSVLCLPIGGHQQSRGAFPSVGYNSFIAQALSLHALAEVANTSTKFTQMQSLITNNSHQIDALKIQNYYRDRVAADSRLYELGAHGNAGGSAKDYRSAWYTNLQGRVTPMPSFTAASQFDVLTTDANYPGSTAYSYTMMWTLPTHSLYSNIASKFTPTSGQPLILVNWGAVGTSASTAQALAAAGEPAAVRVIAGLGSLLMNNVTTIA